MELFVSLRSRSEPLFWFTALMLLMTLVTLVLTQTTSVKVGGVNAWWKPFKFVLSTALYTATVLWLLRYLPTARTGWLEWVIVLSLGFEIVYIVWKAAQGEASHFNVSTPFNSFMWSMMALMATVAALTAAVLFFWFWTDEVTPLPNHVLWAIRLGLVLFVVFAFEGFAMGARMAHTVGAPDGGEGFPVTGWSKRHGDLRIAHFIGMHALEVLPVLAHFVLKSTVFVVIAAIAYAALAVWVLVNALAGRPLVG